MSNILRLRKVPLVRFVVLFVAGVVVTSYFIDTFLRLNDWIIALTIGSGVLCLVFFQIKWIKPTYDYLFLFFLFNASILLTLNKLNNDFDVIETVDCHTGIVGEAPLVKKNSTLLKVKLNVYDGIKKIMLSKCIINLYINSDSLNPIRIKAGDHIKFKGKLKEIRNFGNPGEFDFKKKMAINAVYYQTFVKTDQIENLGPQGYSFIYKYIQQIQDKLIQLIDRYHFSENSKALILALTIGQKKLISEDMREAFTNSGAIHVLAVSGLHVGIIYLIMNFLLGFMNNHQLLEILKILLVLMAIWGYALITGLSSSVIRAALMFSLINIGSSFNRDISFFNILGGAAFITLLINPLLIYDVGFQLSYLAVGGIVYFQPRIYNWFTISNPVLDYAYKLLSVSLAAQLSTAPLTLFYFHQFPSYFWLTNILIIPLIFVILVITFLFLSFSWFPFIVSILGFTLNACCRLATFWVKSIDHLPGSIIDGIYIDSLSVYILYILIGTISLWLINKRNHLIKISLLLIVVLFVNLSVRDVKAKRFEALVVYNVSNSSCIGVFNSGKCSLFHDNNFKQSNTGKKTIKKHLLSLGKVNPDNEYLIESLINKRVENCTDGSFNVPVLKVKNLKILVFYEGLSNNRSVQTIYADYVVVNSNAAPPEFKLNVRNVIIDNSTKFYQSKKWETYAEEHNLKFFNIRKQGAFIRAL